MDADGASEVIESHASNTNETRNESNARNARKPRNASNSSKSSASSKMWGPAFNIVSLPKIACKIVRPFKPDFRERWQVSEFSVSSRKTRSDQGNSRSRLEV